MSLRIDRSALESATHGPILSSLAKLANRSPDNWLPAGHAAIRGELPNNWRAFRNVPINEAIDGVALAAPQHCMDGWAFLSRSLGALLSGDQHASRHLAYYAQLRAGLSMLANMGIGIFNGVNFAITSPTTITRIDVDTRGNRTNSGFGTHAAVWKILHAWSSSGTTALTLLNLIRVRGSTLTNCLSALWPGFSPITSATDLISAWGIDLRRGSEEHQQRNISSYAPQALNPLGQSIRAELAFVEELWNLVEPTSGPNFDKLDRHLLRSMFWRQHELVSGLPREEGAIFSRFASLPAQVATIADRDFLLGRTEPRSPAFLDLARATANPALPTQMIARALLLLRAATAVTYENVTSAGINCANGELRPWLDKLAIQRGYWKPGGELSNTADLFQDVEIALSDLAKAKPTDPACLYDWLSHTQKGIPTVTEAERIGVWCLSG